MTSTCPRRGAEIIHTYGTTCMQHGTVLVANAWFTFTKVSSEGIIVQHAVPEMRRSFDKQ